MRYSVVSPQLYAKECSDTVGYQKEMIHFFNGTENNPVIMISRFMCFWQETKGKFLFFFFFSLFLQVSEMSCGIMSHSAHTFSQYWTIHSLFHSFMVLSRDSVHLKEQFPHNKKIQSAFTRSIVLNMTFFLLQNIRRSSEEGFGCFCPYDECQRVKNNTGPHWLSFKTHTDIFRRQ